MRGVCANIRSQIVIVGSVGTVDSLYNYIHPTYIKEFVCIPVDRVDQCPAHPPAISVKNLFCNAIEGGGQLWKLFKNMILWPKIYPNHFLLYYMKSTWHIYFLTAHSVFREEVSEGKQWNIFFLYFLLSLKLRHENSFSRYWLGKGFRHLYGDVRPVTVSDGELLGD